jgi:hypothetical protein
MTCFGNLNSLEWMLKVHNNLRREFLLRAFFVKGFFEKHRIPVTLANDCMPHLEINTEFYELQRRIAIYEVLYL